MAEPVCVISTVFPSRYWSVLLDVIWIDILSCSKSTSKQCNFVNLSKHRNAAHANSELASIRTSVSDGLEGRVSISCLSMLRVIGSFLTLALANTLCRPARTAATNGDSVTDGKPDSWWIQLVPLMASYTSVLDAGGVKLSEHHAPNTLPPLDAALPTFAKGKMLRAKCLHLLYAELSALLHITFHRREAASFLSSGCFSSARVFQTPLVNTNTIQLFKLCQMTTTQQSPRRSTN